nr:hypothetical protein [uncultured Psychroserpens sp.]
MNNTCSPTMLKMALANLPKKFKIRKNLHKDIYEDLFKLNSKFEKVIKTYDLESKLAENNGFFTISAKDKMYNADYSSQNKKDFIKKVKTRRDGKTVDWENKEKKIDKALSSLYESTKSSRISKYGSIQINTCEVKIYQIVTIKKMTLKKMTMVPFVVMLFDCKCSEKSLKTDVDHGKIVFSTDVEVTFQNDTFDLNAMLFKVNGNSRYWLERAICCKDKNEDKEKD